MLPKEVKLITRRIKMRSQDNIESLENKMDQSIKRRGKQIFD